MCFGNRTQRTSNPPFSGEIQLFTLITQKTLGDPILPMLSLCLSDVEVWDSSIQWISVYSLGIELNSWIGVKIL